VIMKIREEELYGDIVQWLDKYLRENIPGSDFIKVVDSHSEYLCDSIYKIMKDVSQRYKEALPKDYISWMIKVDIYGLIGIKDKLKIILVEVKSSEVTLEHIAQLIGYAKIVKPDLAVMITPEGVSGPLFSLLVGYGRLDLLEYVDRGNRPGKIHIVKWNINKKDIEHMWFLPTRLDLDIKSIIR